MSQEFSLEFDPFDHPTQLRKVGNWIFTFLSTPEEMPYIQLAITNVMPRHISDELQPRCVIIHNTEDENIWKIEVVECFNSQTNQEMLFAAADPQSQLVLKSIITEFARYDVNLTLKSL